MQDFSHLFMNYILPFLMLVMILAYAAMKVQAYGGPGILAVIFFTVLFGPSLLYALIADDSSSGLFMGSLIMALAVVAILAFFQSKKSKAAAKIVREIAITGIEDEAAPSLIIFDNGTTHLVSEWFPWENSKISEETLTEDLAKLLNIKIIRTDRERFLIMSSDAEILKQIILYLREKSKQ